jgi:hypothetical protein
MNVADGASNSLHPWAGSLVLINIVNGRNTGHKKLLLRAGIVRKITLAIKVFNARSGHEREVYNEQYAGRVLKNRNGGTLWGNLQAVSTGSHNKIDIKTVKRERL